MWTRPLLATVVLAQLGCDALTVPRFSGTIIEMTLAGVPPSAAGHHLELWARDGLDDVIRVVGANADGNPAGLRIVPAVTLADPCMIDEAGHLLTSPDAYPRPVTHDGVTQTPEQQAQQVKNRIAQVTGTDLGGQQAQTMLAVIPYDPTPAPTVAVDALPADRLAACQAYWNASPLSYTPNPAQLTAPLHGLLYGVVAYTTTSPPAASDGVRLECPIALGDTRELWLTDEQVEAAQVDPVHRGPVFLDGKPTHGGNEVLHFDLSGAVGSGTAALEVKLDQDTVSF